MKLLLRSLLFLFAGQVLPSGTAFVLVPTHPFISRSVIGNRPFAAAVAAAAAVALEPEPPGGIELIASAVSMGSDCRMKQLDVVAEKVSRQQSSADAFTFWMTASAQGKLIQEIRSTILKDASKKANFPGFRKGQVPPYAQPQITQFAVQEAIIKTVEAAVEAYGLQSLPGSEGEVQVHENVSDLAKAYKTGDSIQFTATLNASYDPQKKPISSGSRSGGGGGTVVDVEATTVEVEAAVAVEESIVDVDATVAVQESIVAEVEANVGAEPEATVEAEA